MNTVLKYPGAKNRLAPWIVSYIPKHKVYLEPFFGSGAIFFNKEPSHIETINDLNSDVYNFFKVLREHGDILAEHIKMTPFCREEYEQAYKNETYSEIEKARIFAVKCWQGFGCSNLYRNGFRSGQREKSPDCAKAWNQIPERLLEAADRLKMAQIENLPAIELMGRYDTEDVFIYCDPPYLHGTRKNYLYKHEMEDSEHEELLKILAAHQGRVLLSGYDNEMYNDYLSGWSKAQKDTSAENGLRRTETIWMNYEVGAGQMQLELVR